MNITFSLHAELLKHEAENFTINIKEQYHRKKKKVKTITRWEKLLSPNDSSVMDKFITKEELSNLREISDCLSMNFNEVMWKVDDAPVHH